MPSIIADRVNRHRVSVIAPCVTDVVVHIGGWLADHALAGWDVDVLLPDAQEAQPLRILGASARVLDLDTAVAVVPPAGRTLAVATCLFARHADRLRTFARGGARRVVLWGPPPAESARRGLVVENYTVTGAALAFKQHALRVVHQPPVESAEPEVLYTGTGRRVLLPMP